MKRAERDEIDGDVTDTLERIASTLEFDGAVLYWHVPELDVLWPLSLFGSFMDRIPPVRPGTGIVGSAYARRRPTLAGPLEIERSGARWHRSEGVQTLLALPLASGARAFGMVATFARSDRDVADPDVARVALLAAQLIDVLGTAALWPIAQLQRFQINTLAEMVHECAASDDELRICGIIARHALLLTGADTVGIAGAHGIDLFEGGYARSRPTNASRSASAPSWCRTTANARIRRFRVRSGRPARG